MSPTNLEFPYRPRWTVVALGGLFFGLCAVVLGYQAARNDRGLVLNRILELGPDGATIFYWVLTACSVGFVVLAGLMAILRLTVRQRIAFGPTAVVVPVSRWSRREKEIPYADIRELAETSTSGQRFFRVSYAGGNYLITASMLPSRADFDEVCRLLMVKAAEAAAQQR